MPDEAVSSRDINWRETFPFTHLFRAFRVAVHPSKLILALVALGCLWCGGLILHCAVASQVPGRAGRD